MTLGSEDQFLGRGAEALSQREVRFTVVPLSTLRVFLETLVPLDPLVQE